MVCVGGTECTFPNCKKKRNHVHCDLCIARKAKTFSFDFGGSHLKHAKDETALKIGSTCLALGKQKKRKQNFRNSPKIQKKNRQTKAEKRNPDVGGLGFNIPNTAIPESIDKVKEQVRVQKKNLPNPRLAETKLLHDYTSVQLKLVNSSFSNKNANLFAPSHEPSYKNLTAKKNDELLSCNFFFREYFKFFYLHFVVNKCEYHFNNV